MERYARYIKLGQEYEQNTKSIKTGKYKSDYLDEVGVVIENYYDRFVGHTTLEFEDGQRWCFDNKQIKWCKKPKTWRNNEQI